MAPREYGSDERSLMCNLFSIASTGRYCANGVRVRPMSNGLIGEVC